MPPRTPRAANGTSIAGYLFFQDAPQWRCYRCQQRNFSVSSSHKTRLRRDMFMWLNGPGKALKEPLPGSSNYLGAYDKKGRLLRQQNPTTEADAQKANQTKDKAPELEKESLSDLRPFPLNNSFYAQSILSEELRNEIYRRVKVLGQPVRLVSAQLGVELKRVGAVVRLAEIEQRWRAEGKQLAVPYARAVHEMVPTTPLSKQNRPTPHESINDLPVHSSTHPQIFWPTSESRLFNRTDAGRVFSGAHRLPDENTAPSTANPERFEIVGKPGHEREVLLPADARIPHPHLVDYHKDTMNPDLSQNQQEIKSRYDERIASELMKVGQAKERKRQIEQKQLKRVEHGRWSFMFKEVQATREGTGLDGRGTKSPGYRYGVPHEDRKRAQVKIPRRVEV